MSFAALRRLNWKAVISAFGVLIVYSDASEIMDVLAGSERRRSDLMDDETDMRRSAGFGGSSSSCGVGMSVLFRY